MTGALPEIAFPENEPSMLMVPKLIMLPEFVMIPPELITPPTLLLMIPPALLFSRLWPLMIMLPLLLMAPPEVIILPLLVARVVAFLSVEAYGLFYVCYGT